MSPVAVGLTPLWQFVCSKIRRLQKACTVKTREPKEEANKESSGVFCKYIVSYNLEYSSYFHLYVLIHFRSEALRPLSNTDVSMSRCPVFSISRIWMQELPAASPSRLMVLLNAMNRSGTVIWRLSTKLTLSLAKDFRQTMGSKSVNGGLVSKSVEHSHEGLKFSSANLLDRPHRPAPP